MSHRTCKFCSKMVIDHTHLDGTPVCKCPTRGCKGNERWLEYDAFEELQKTDEGQFLWEADPTCQHNIQSAAGGGVKCTKCPGWFCF